jgi:hypothetical protein
MKCYRRRVHRAQDLEKKRKASDKALKEEAKNAKRRKAVVEAATHAITLLGSIAARGLGTVESLQVKDLKAMLQYDDPQAPEAKGNKADMKERVPALAGVKEEAHKFVSAAAERAVIANAVSEQAPCVDASAPTQTTTAAPEPRP